MILLVVVATHGWLCLFLLLLSLLGKRPPHFIGSCCIRVSGKESGLGRNNNLPSVGRIYSLETVGSLQIGAPLFTDARFEWTGIPCDTLQTYSYGIFSVIPVEGYRARQQSAVVVSEYIPSLIRRRKTCLLTVNCRSTLHCSTDVCGLLWTFLYCIRVSTEGSGFERNNNLPAPGRIYSHETVRNLQIWSMTMLILALHELESLVSPSKLVHTVFSVIAVEGYRKRQQSAVVITLFLSEGVYMLCVWHDGLCHCRNELVHWKMVMCLNKSLNVHCPMKNSPFCTDFDTDNEIVHWATGKPL